MSWCGQVRKFEAPHLNGNYDDLSRLAGRVPSPTEGRFPASILSQLGMQRATLDAHMFPDVSSVLT